MKTRFTVIFFGSIIIVSLVGTTPVISAPPEATGKTGIQVPGSNAIPQSNFTIPSNFSEGRDPFYPNARYMFGGPRIVRPIPVTPGADLLHLDGISGTLDHKLAMINYRTMATGETNDVNTTSGRLRIRCIEIRSDSVTVEVIGGERRELHLRD